MLSEDRLPVTDPPDHVHEIPRDSNHPLGYPGPESSGIHPLRLRPEGRLATCLRYPQVSRGLLGSTHV